MKRSRALELLAHSKPTLAERYGVVQLALWSIVESDVPALLPKLLGLRAGS